MQCICCFVSLCLLLQIFPCVSEWYGVSRVAVVSIHRVHAFPICSRNCNGKSVVYNVVFSYPETGLVTGHDGREVGAGT